MRVSEGLWVSAAARSGLRWCRDLDMQVQLDVDNPKPLTPKLFHDVPTSLDRKPYSSEAPSQKNKKALNPRKTNTSLIVFRGLELGIACAKLCAAESRDGASHYKGVSKLVISISGVFLC